MKFCATFAHPHLCKLLAFSVDGPSRCLVFEYCSGGSLGERLLGTKMDKGAGRLFPTLSPEHRFRICAEIARALTYLHDGNAYHRDVKVQFAAFNMGPLMPA